MMDERIIHIDTERVQKYVRHIVHGLADIGTDELAQDFAELTMALQIVLCKATEKYFDENEFAEALRLFLQHSDLEIDKNVAKND